MSSYIQLQGVSVTEATENITVSCTVTQSEPALICRAVFYCTGVENSTSLTLSNDVAQNFTTNQMCNVTIQVVSSSDIYQVLEESFSTVCHCISPPDSKWCTHNKHIMYMHAHVQTHSVCASVSVYMQVHVSMLCVICSYLVRRKMVCKASSSHYSQGNTHIKYAYIGGTLCYWISVISNIYL